MAMYLMKMFRQKNNGVYDLALMYNLQIQSSLDIFMIATFKALIKWWEEEQGSVKPKFYYIRFFLRVLELF